MQPKFTQSNLWVFWRKVFVIALIFVSISKYSYSQIDLFNEGFATVPPAGWAQQNLSTTIGTVPTWAQGDGTNLFPSHSGGPNDYILGNYNNLGATGTIISNWLFTPTVTLTNGDVFSFWTRTVDAPQFPDRLQVRLSTNGTSVDVGATDVSVGDYSTLLLDINPTYDVAGYPNVWTLQSITITGLAAPTQGRIAFRYFVEDGGPFGNNSDNVGIDDAEYFQSVSPPCAGTPTPGNTLSTTPSACPGTTFALTVENETPGTGVTYQWQSATALAGPYTDIAGATNNAYSTTLTEDTYYQLMVTCSGSPATSTPVLVTLTPQSGCYCIPPPSDCATFDDVITNVTFGGINNSSDCSATGYTNYGALPPGAAQAGAPNPMSVDVGFGGFEAVNVWIDYNHNGAWDADEYSLLGIGNGSTVLGNINIPGTSLPGITRMRVRLSFGALTPDDPCTDIGDGETEDYNVDIAPCIVGAFTAQPTDATATCGGTTTFTAATSGTAMTYQWEVRTSASAVWEYVVDGPNYSGATAATLTVSSISDAMTGYQYRVIITGGCTAADFSDPATLTVDHLIVDVSPVSVDVCSTNATVVPLQITSINPVGGSVTETTSFPSGAVNLPIPDGDDEGVINSIAVVVPAGAVVSAASVKLNISHTWIGDLSIALKAPNGNVLNLDYGLTQTGGSGPTTGFTNTIISSAGVNTLVSGSDPWTGTFAPDAPTAPGGVPTAPTLLSPTNANVFTFAGLYSVPNGNWTIGALDFQAPDNGTILDWELTLTYTYPVGLPYNGVWTPAAGLFSDAAGTIPYVDGTETNIVYTLPTTNTTYTVTPVTPICTGDPVTIPINISNPIGALTQPADAAICANDAASFVVSAASGNDIAYQWQVSVDGTTYTDISNSGVYSGATTNTLSLSNVPATYNGYKYRVVLNVALCGSSATSDAATLTINPSPTVTISAAPYTALYPGLVTVLSATPTDLASYQWFLNGVAIPGANSATYQANIDGLGDYTVTAVSSGACPATSTGSVTIRDSVTTTLFIYPNPNNGVFQVRYNDGVNDLLARPRVLTIYDSKGSRVYSKTFTVNVPFGRMDVDLSRQSKGVYVIDLTDFAGKRLQSERVIIR